MARNRSARLKALASADAAARERAVAGGGTARDLRFSASDGRRFSFPVGGAFLVLAGIMAWRGHAVAMWSAGVVGLALLGSGAVAPSRLGPIYRAWMGLGRAISRVTTPVFLSVVYVLVLAPTGLLRRTVGSSPLHRTAAGESYWVSRERQRGDLRRQF